jgi:glutamate decarboxylase
VLPILILAVQSLTLAVSCTEASFTLNFSRGASQIIGQYYQMIRLGKRGYRAIMMNLTRTADYLSKNLEHLGFIIMSKGAGEGLPLVAFRLDPKKKALYDEFQIAHQLRERGWVVPAYTMVYIPYLLD